MHPDIEKLIELERVDREIAKLRAEIAALPQRVAAIEKKLAGTLANLDAAKAGIKQNDANRRKYEGEIQALQQKISKYRDQSLNVKTNQEYRALQDEVEFAEKEIRRCEDKILELMVDTETREATIKERERELASERKEVEAEQNEARARTAEDQKQLSELEPKRAAIRAGLDETHLRHYDRVQKGRGNAVAEAVDQRCMACHVLLRPQVFQDVLNGAEVVTCDSCSRFLWHRPEEKAAAPDASATTAEQA